MKSKEQIIRAAVASLGEMHLIGEGKKECHECGKEIGNETEDYYIDDGMFDVCKACYEGYEREMAEHDPNDLSWIMEDANGGLESCLLNANGILSRRLR